jgi:hypothetical protein
MSEAQDYDRSAKDSIAILVMVFAALFSLIYFLPEFHQGLWFAIKKIEIYAILIISKIDVGGMLISNQMAENVDFINEKINEIPIGSFKWRGMINTDAATGYFAYVFNVILILTGLVLALKNKEEFKTRYDLESLLEITSRTWRTQRYLLKYNPLKISGYDATKSNFRLRDKPVSYLENNNVITFEGNDFFVDKIQLGDVLQKQLGKEFTSVKEMKDFEQVLFAAFALVICQINKKCKPVKKVAEAKIVSEDLLGDLSYFYNDEFSLSDMMKSVRKINDYALKQDKIKNIVNRHAFDTTLLRGMLAEVRKSAGVYASALFSCIAVEDRVQFVSLFDEGMGESGVEVYAIKQVLMYEMKFNKKCLKADPARAERMIDMYLTRAFYDKAHGKRAINLV